MGSGGCTLRRRGDVLHEAGRVHIMGMHSTGNAHCGVWGGCTPRCWGHAHYGVGGDAHHRDKCCGFGGAHCGVRGCPPWGACMPTLRAACGIAAEPPCLRELEKIQIQEATKKKPGEWGNPGPFPPAVPHAAGLGRGWGAPWGALALHVFGGGWGAIASPQAPSFPAAMRTATTGGHSASRAAASAGAWTSTGPS